MQRTRMLGAAVTVVDELGYEGMSVARVTARARLSRRTFYELFAGRADCFLAVCEDAVARAGARAHAAYAAGSPRWHVRVRAGLCALLGFFDEEPQLAVLCVVEALGAGRAVLERRGEVLAALAQVVDEGRLEARSGRELAAQTAEGVVGAVLALVHARLLEGDERPLSDLLNPLMSMIVLPYLGAAAAARELREPVSPAPGRKPKQGGDPLADIQMRLTYRTLRVLSAIASCPGASNRQVADTADVHDPGQISKLLGRLARLGLIVNNSHGHAKGEPNAWQLTARGQEVEQIALAQ